MTIAVLGAHGRSGRIFIKLALENGHSIIAGVRTAYDRPKHPKITFQKCDATNADEVRALTAKADILISLIGHGKGVQKDLHVASTKAVLAALQSLPPKRYISLTGTGVRTPGDKITLMDRVLTAGILLLDRNRVIDGRKAFALLYASNISWTLIRVVKLTNGTGSGYQLRPHGPGKILVPRTEAAYAILTCLEKDMYLQSAPIISKLPRGAQNELALAGK